MKKLIIASLAVAVLLLACGEEEGVTPRKPDRLEPTTPANVLKNVEISFNQRDINLLRAMLSESFVFYFDPHDVGRKPPFKNYTIPESWGYQEFLGAAKNLSKLAYYVSCSIPTGKVGEPREGEKTYRGEDIPISLLVMIDEATGFLVSQGHCSYGFEQYEAEGGKKYWRLTEWCDYTGLGYYDTPGTRNHTVGMVLAYYHH